ncbi:hypothetical protein Naga_101185g3 [Nannochloropsis gaditana]|uniref:Uncharacterized protein n=1 Tax=Nannochloropsis gaditana TaxID=72520 RepID=W7THU8_9STRA|nr:hypothetical protein Naga_101185g3 [Nannochloropsis gaditana]
MKDRCTGLHAHRIHSNLHAWTLCGLRDARGTSTCIGAESPFCVRQRYHGPSEGGPTPPMGRCSPLLAIRAGARRPPISRHVRGNASLIGLASSFSIVSLLGHESFLCIL